MLTNTKLVTAPIHNKDMDIDLESKIIYVFDYDNSEKFDKVTDFLDYINNVGLISDIYFKDTNENIRTELLLYYMNSKNFNHILSFNVAIMNCIYKLKKINLRLKGSALTDQMEYKFTENNKELLNSWKCFFDSYLLYMIAYATNNNKPIKNRYSEDKICYDSNLSPNIVSIFLDDFFYDYFKTGIDEDSVKYWKYYYDNKLYDNKTFNTIMLNDANFVIKILLCSAKTKQWEQLSEKHFKQ